MRNWRRNLPPSNPHRDIAGIGPAPCRYLAVIGEPDEDDSSYGILGCGRNGQLLDDFLRTVDFSREKIRIESVVNRWCKDGATPADVARNQIRFQTAVEESGAVVILTLGALAAKQFLGEDVDLDAVHGIPHEWQGGKLVIPTYHPAAGFFSPETAARTYADFQQFKKISKGSPDLPGRGYPVNLMWTVDQTIPEPAGVRVGVDTEGWADNPWCLSYSTTNGEAHVVMTEHADGRRIEGNEIVMHNALHDLTVLRRMGVTLKGKLHDTMVLAYLIGVEPQGLKPLATRWLREEMKPYTEVVKPYFDAAMLEYLEWVNECEWSIPEARVVQDHPAVKPRVYTPQGLNRRVAGVLKKVAEGKDVDFGKLWKDIPADVRAEAEKVRPAPEFSLALVPTKKATYYAAKDPDVTRRIFPYLMQAANRLQLGQVYKVDMDFLPYVAAMQETGMRVNLRKVEALKQQLGREMRVAARKLSDMGCACNPQSGDQVADIVNRLYGGFVKKTKSKKRIATDDQTLEGIANSADLGTEHGQRLKAFIDGVLDFREALKTLTTFVEPLPEFIARTGRIHPRARITRVATGRISMAEPNLLAFPAHSARGRAVRACFEAPKGWVYCGIDYSQIELRVMAHLSEDPVMLKAFREGADLHAITAQNIFKVEDYTKPQRQAGKLLNFSMMFEMQSKSALAQGRAMGLSYTLEDWEQRLIPGWFETYAGVRPQLKRSHMEARQHGFVRDWLGRIRWVPLVHSRDEFVRAEAERQAGNFPIQAGATEVMKIAAGRILPEITGKEKEIRPLLAIHDELIFEIKEDVVDKWIPLLVELMTTQPFEGQKFRVPITVDPKTSKDWAGLKG